MKNRYREISEMSAILRWKKTLPLALAAGIICLSAYGIYNTVYAFTGAGQSASPGNAASLSSSAPQDSLVPGGTVCHPRGCAACGGYTALLFRENVGSSPEAAFGLELIN